MYCGPLVNRFVFVEKVVGSNSVTWQARMKLFRISKDDIIRLSNLNFES